MKCLEKNLFVVLALTVKSVVICCFFCCFFLTVKLCFVLPVVQFLKKYQETPMVKPFWLTYLANSCLYEPTINKVLLLLLLLLTPHPPSQILTIACLTFCLLLTYRQILGAVLGLPGHRLNVVNICEMHRCMIKIFQGGRGGDTFKTPSPYEQLLPLPPPVLRCFWKGPSMTPTTPFEHLSLLPPPHPPPLTPKNFNHTPGQGRVLFRSFCFFGGSRF